MTGTLIFILFILNILLALALILLYMRQNRMADMEKRQQMLLAESEQVVASLIEEIKEENADFLMKIRENQKLMGEPALVQKAAESKSQENIETEVQAEAAHSKEILEQVANRKPEPLQNKVDQLAAKGLTVTEIARTLQKGKTEIELLMKFR